MSVPLTLAPVPAPSSSSTTATPVSPITSPSDTTAGMNSPTSPNSTTASNSTSNSSTTSNSNSNNNSESSTAPSKRKASRRANTAERRATHNAVERQRRETLNGRFLDLAALLPNLATVRRPSKSAIVNSSIALIHSHRRARAAAGRELRALEEETQALRREVNEWRARTGAIPPLQAPQRSPEFIALLHAGEADDEGAAAEEERRAYLLAGQGGVEDDEEEWDANTNPIVPNTQVQAQAQQQQQQHPQSVGPASYNVPMMATAAGPGMMDEKMAHYALQYAMQMQGMHHGHGHTMSVGPDPRMAMAALQAQRSEHPQWSATAAPHTPTTPSTAGPTPGGPTLFARPVPIPQSNHGHFSGPFAFGVPPLNTNTANTFNTTGYLSTTSPANGGFVVGSPTGSTPPATTSSSFEDAGTESEGEHGMGGINMGGMGGMNGMNGKWMQQQGVRTGGPGGFAAMGMGVVI